MVNGMVVLVLLALVTHPLVFGDIDHKLVVFSLIVFNVQDRTFSSKWCEQLNVSWMRSCVEIFALNISFKTKSCFKKHNSKLRRYLSYCWTEMPRSTRDRDRPRSIDRCSAIEIEIIDRWKKTRSRSRSTSFSIADRWIRSRQKLANWQCCFVVKVCAVSSLHRVRWTVIYFEMES